MRIQRVKLRPPAILFPLTERPRLVNRLGDAARARLTLLMAPAGFGKSSLLLQWYQALRDQGKGPCWLTVDKTLNDAGDLLAYLLAAIGDGAPGNGGDLGELLYNDNIIPADYLLDRLLDLLDSRAEPCHVFIDDFHLLGDDAVAAIGELLEQSPDGMHFYIASRTTPKLPLARARAMDAVVEIDAQALKFSLQETREFLDQNTSEAIQDATLADLVAGTEGWITGLKLASLAMRRGVAPDKLLGTVNGRNRTVAEYFSEEVLSPQNSAIRDFMVKTCILERFCPELCNAVTGSDDARAMINEVEAKGLFLFQLDEERHWYRYHHLFANYLARQLGESDPALKQQLHLRASRWLQEEGFVTEAMEHALQSGDMTHAASLLEASCHDFTYNGNIRLVARFAGKIPEAVLNRQPRTLLTLSWFHTRGMRFEKSEEILATTSALIDQLEAEGALGDAQIRELRYLLLHRRMLLTSARDDVVTLEKQCRQLLDDYPEMTHPYMVGTTYCHLLLSRREQYKLDDLEQLWLSVKGVESRSPYAFLVPALRADLGPSLFFAGKTAAAMETLEGGLDKGIRYAGARSAIAALPALPLAELAYEGNDLQRAEQLLADALPSARKMGYIDQLMPGVLTLARLHRARGNHDEALGALDGGMVIALDRDLERFRLALVNERIRYLIQDGDVNGAIRYARQSGILIPGRDMLPHPGVTTSDELLASAWVRIALARKSIADGLHVAKHWRAFCAKRGAIRSLVRWDLLHAQLYFLDGQESEAQRPLREALAHGAASALRRSFIDEGALVKTLLTQAYGLQPVTAEPAETFASELLRIFEGATDTELLATAADTEGLHDSLTNNELKILTMAGHGLRNREIASRLGMTEGSIKWYMQQIYDKLGTRPRTRAIDKARKLGLIP
ncbi:MAG: LuxR C-terminal-related transcriptional regulator [Pseudomonadota bacterium]|nr:LuxR C-terminal-related transcriptional regulator [Pseudomonadota bacterium]